MQFSLGHKFLNVYRNNSFNDTKHYLQWFDGEKNSEGWGGIGRKMGVRATARFSAKGNQLSVSGKPN